MFAWFTTLLCSPFLLVSAGESRGGPYDSSIVAGITLGGSGTTNSDIDESSFGGFVYSRFFGLGGSPIDGSFGPSGILIDDISSVYNDVFNPPMYIFVESGLRRLEALRYSATEHGFSGDFWLISDVLEWASDDPIINWPGSDPFMITRIFFNYSFKPDSLKDEFDIVFSDPSLSFATASRKRLVSISLAKSQIGSGVKDGFRHEVVFPDPVGSHETSTFPSNHVSWHSSVGQSFQGCLDVINIIFSDETIDADGDGRFSQQDVSWISQNYDANFDFNGNLVIDAVEIDTIQRILDIDGGSGLLGDSDGDGARDCGDISLAYAQFSDTDGNGVEIVEYFPNSDYIIELDADLDGDNDADDKDVVAETLRRLERANFHFDGTLNFFDYTAFKSLWDVQDPRADLFPIDNPDGVFNFFDISQFWSYYNNPQCF